MGRPSLPTQDILLDVYYNHLRKEIIIAHFKHGTSYLTDTIRDNAVWIYMKANSEKLGIEDLGHDKLQFMQPRYDDYKKFITYRSVEESFASAFCYEMRTGLASFVVDENRMPEYTEAMIRKFIDMAGGVQPMLDLFVNRVIHSNGTLMSVFYAKVFPKVIPNILEYVDAIIPVKDLTDFFEERDVPIPNKIANATPSRVLTVVKKVFDELGVNDILKELVPEQFDYKEKLLQKPLYNTI